MEIEENFSDFLKNNIKKLEKKEKEIIQKDEIFSNKHFILLKKLDKFKDAFLIYQNFIKTIKKRD